MQTELEPTDELVDSMEEYHINLATQTIADRCGYDEENFFDGGFSVACSECGTSYFVELNGSVHCDVCGGVIRSPLVILRMV